MSTRAERWRRAVAAASAVLVGTTLATASAGAREGPAPQPGAVPEVQWGTCAPEELEPVPPGERDRYECARYPVPLDHNAPERGSVDLALMRRKAADPERRIGSLFVNPGGPGGSGYTMPTQAGKWLDDRVLERFDVVGFDPRGIDRSTRLRCFTSAEQAHEVAERITPVPVSDERIAETLGAYRDQGRHCERNAGALLDHMSTADVARDLDLLRAAVGDRKLTYVGFSYGTLLGATYLSLFGERSRAVVLDGNVDPQLRTTNGVEYDRQRARGFEIALQAFLRECDSSGRGCAFSAGDPRAKFDAIREELRSGPVTLPNGVTLTLSTFTAGVGSALYDIGDLAPLAADLQLVHEHLTGAAVGQAQQLRVLDRTPHRAPYDGGPAVPQREEDYVDDAYFGVNCTDKPIPRIPELVPGIAAAWEHESPTFGRYQAFSDVAACSNWPRTADDAHRGPWHNSAENPALVFGNRYDPATQHAFAERMAHQLGHADLVTVNSFGHCILGRSACADRIAADYLIELRRPAPGQTCSSDEQPFGAA
ncbi:alpha/beta hydrolase [Salinifilum aidingensis]